MYRVILLASLALSTPTFAAEKAPDVILHPVSDVEWSGFYAGAALEGSFSTGRSYRGAFSGTLIPLDVRNGLFPDSIDGSDWGIRGNVSAGYDVQRGAFVGGIVGDLSFGNHRIDNAFSMIDPNPAFPFTGVTTNTSYITEFGTSGSLRLKAGAAFGKNQVYVSGGLAAGQVKNRFMLSIPDFPAVAGGPYTSPDWSHSGVKMGYAIGAGFERKMTKNVSVTFDALYTDLKDTAAIGTDPAAFPGEAINYHFENKRLAINVGFKYRF